jgi:hypothetical protein
MQKLGHIIVAGALACFVQAASAYAGTIPSEELRTASWYAANPQIRARILAACSNDPGHSWNHPDCINAHQGSVMAAAAEAQRNTGIIGPPASSPEYWRRRPEARAERLAYCGRMKPQDQAAYFCDAARGGGVVTR